MSVTGMEHVTLVGVAGLLDEGDRLLAWAERHVRKDPDLRWVLGNYVESDTPNSNGHIFPYQELLVAQDTLVGKPLNMMHREHYIVGSFVGAQMVDGHGTAVDGTTVHEVARRRKFAGSTDESPHVEALAAMWHTRFPEEFFNIQRAHKEGTLFFSMEAVPEQVSCPTCTHKADFAGISSDSYCDHMQGPTGPKVLHKPTFNGGAIIIPPVKPGWGRADVKAISRMINEDEDRAESMYAQAAAGAPHLGPSEWEAAMAEILRLADSLEDKAFSGPRRKKLAKSGNALPDGSFPIESPMDVKNAVQSIGRAKDPAAARAHIKKMAKKLGCMNLVPEGW